jgi:hypothetical protein
LRGKGIRYEKNNKIDLKEAGFEDVDWFQLIQARFQWQAAANVVLNTGLYEKTKFFINWTFISFSRRTLLH